MRTGWIEEARRTLEASRGRAGVWAYRPGLAPAAEPTALAGLAFHAIDGNSSMTARVAADWLASTQRPDGSIGVTADLNEPGWATPYALRLWGERGGHEVPRKRALAWLLDQQGLPLEVPTDGSLGHDTTLVGWSWLPETHSWLEPTALAILAIRREGRGDHPRVSEGLRLIADRAIDEGGWNYGNCLVFGRSLRPQPGPTGLALLALAGTDSSRKAPYIERAIRYLEATLPGVRSATSLGWGLLGLDAWGRRPEDSDAWIAESAASLVHRPGPAPAEGLALLILAANHNIL